MPLKGCRFGLLTVTRHRGKDYTQLMKYLSRYGSMDCPALAEINLVWNNEDSPGESGALLQAS